MDIEILRGEIERLFSLDELTALSRDLLGFDPHEVGGTNAKATFARALTERCVEVDAVDALVEAILGSRTNADPRLRDWNQKGFSVNGEKIEDPARGLGPADLKGGKYVLLQKGKKNYALVVVE